MSYFKVIIKLERIFSSGFVSFLFDPLYNYMLINVLFFFFYLANNRKRLGFMRYTKTNTLVLVGLPEFEPKPPQTESRNSDRWIMKKLHNFM